MGYRVRTALSGTYAGPGGGFTIPVVNRIAAVVAATLFEQVLFSAPAFTTDAGNGNDTVDFGRTTFYTVKAVYFTPDTTQAGATATASTYTINKYNAAGGGVLVVATFVGITGADFTAFVAKNFGAITNATLKTGETLTIAKTVASTGTATPAGLITVDLV